jgi:hypothetical protein
VDIIQKSGFKYVKIPLISTVFKEDGRISNNHTGYTAKGRNFLKNSVGNAPGLTIWAIVRCALFYALTGGYIQHLAHCACLIWLFNLCVQEVLAVVHVCC